ncbi:hypothetical protein PJM70_20315 [Mycobacterium kansasii]
MPWIGTPLFSAAKPTVNGEITWRSEMLGFWYGPVEGLRYVAMMGVLVHKPYTIQYL